MYNVQCTCKYYIYLKCCGKHSCHTLSWPSGYPAHALPSNWRATFVNVTWSKDRVGVASPLGRSQVHSETVRGSILLSLLKIQANIHMKNCSYSPHVYYVMTSNYITRSRYTPANGKLAIWLMKLYFMQSLTHSLTLSFAGCPGHQHRGSSRIWPNPTKYLHIQPSQVVASALYCLYHWHHHPLTH